MDPVHTRILEAARAIAGSDWTFRIRDLVAALPHLNAGTVRTHVSSRCCANAPANHQTRYSYFRAFGSGLYRVEPPFRRRPSRRQIPSQDRILASVDSGVDPTLLARTLSMSPTERLEVMARAARGLDALRPR
jgi:hypothetical protein